MTAFYGVHLERDSKVRLERGAGQMICTFLLKHLVSGRLLRLKGCIYMEIKKRDRDT